MKRMFQFFPRLLLTFAAIVLAIVALMHTSCFSEISIAVAKSDLVPFVSKGLKVLYLQFSVTAIVLAVVFATAAVRPGAVSKAMILLLALVPVITAALRYYFIGSHMGLIAGVAAILGGLRYFATNRA
ncbi:MAG TPA: hypothetical protein VFU09_01855 [Candidatus Udaeobacter sp.]|nr:hypothetical protein [Candidatus Udaeobacter sp.]